MSKRDLYLSDEWILSRANAYTFPTSAEVKRTAVKVRDRYESARAKDAELIQMAVDACTDPHKMSLAAKFLDAALAEGFTPTPEQ